MATVSGLLIVLIALLVIAGVVALVVALVAKPKAVSDVPAEDRSYFDGGYWAYIGYSILVGFVTLITLGIAFPWMCCLMQRWKAKHTIVNGKRMYFDGTGLQLIGRFILWWFLTLITFGIYGLWMALAIKKWLTKHTHFVGEEDNNSYFDGGFWGFIGTNILAGLVLFVPVVGFVWSDIIQTRWMTEHTVVDSRRLVFTGKVGHFFLKYLLWGFLTGITFGIFGLFMPVKIMKLEAEHTIDHEHTPEALAKQSEYRNTVRTDSANFKSYRVEDEMEGIKAGITDATEKDALKGMADNGLRSAQYLYATRYAEEQYTEEPYSSMLKAAAEAEYAPAMSLYALTHDAENRGELLDKAAAKGQLPAIRNRMVFNANRGLADAANKDSLAALKEAVRLGDLLVESGETLNEEEQALLKSCVLAIRKLESAWVKKRGGGAIVAVVIAAVVAFLVMLFIAISMLLFRGVPVMDTRPNTMTGGYSSSYDEPAAMPAGSSGIFG